MNLLSHALLVDSIATGITLIISGVVARRQPAPFLKCWILAHACSFAVLLLHLVLQYQQSPLLILSMVALSFFRAWYLTATGDHIQKNRVPIPFKKWGLFVAFLLSAGMQLAGMPVLYVGFLPVLAIAFSSCYLGLVFLERKSPWLGWSLVALGTTNILYPFSHPQYGWIGFHLGAIIVTITGLGMIIFALEEKEKAVVAAKQAQIQALKEADRIKDEFLTVLSHELRTPLNAITGFGSILADELAGPLNEKQLLLTTHILGGSERMLELINNMLDYARIQANKLDLRITRFSYQNLIEKTLALLESLAQEKQLSFISDIQVDHVALDEARIAQVLTNLVGNAIKFSPTGKSIYIQAKFEDDMLITRVTDEGLGISQEDLAKLFVPFQQLDMGLTRQAGGTGLGLSISKALVEAHGGQIEASSPGTGMGSTFTYKIPIGPLVLDSHTK